MGNLEFLDIALNSHSNLMLLADSPDFAWLGKLSQWAKVALGLGFVIFIHELGHFLAAKTFGVRCDKFYVGFDVPIKIGPIRLPRTLGKFQWGETEYGIGIIPLGGYVKMLGQDDDPRNAQTEADRARAGSGEDAPLDPRSYPAKPVWQRMIIISAGVVMNLISAVFLAAAAYFYGVPYPPSIVGSVNAGGPAWLAGLEPGDQVLRVGAEGEDDYNLRFADLTTGVVIHGFRAKGQPLPLHVDRQGKSLTLNPIPSPRYDPKGRAHLLGFTSEQSTELAPGAIDPLSPLKSQNLDLQAKDRVVAVDGQPLPVDSRLGTIRAAEFRRHLQARWNQPVKLTLLRPADATTSSAEQTIEVELPALAKNSLGIGFAIGPVTTIQADSLGKQAGFEVGDLIVSIDGTPVVDALAVPELFASKAGNQVTLTVQRGSAEQAQQLDLTVQAPAKATFDNVSLNGSGELSLGGIGVAFDVKSTVSAVTGGAATDGQVQVGDKLTAFRWQASDEQSVEAKKAFNLDLLVEDREINAYNNVASLMELIQRLPVNSKFVCQFDRSGSTVEATLISHPSTELYRTDERDLMFVALKQVHRTDQISTALSLGLWETKRRLTEVLGFLRLLVTGQIGVGGLAGPVRLVDFAAQEASHGTSRLLIFLTLLSANLAILNFLPIPALDGGHMMFLTCEAIRGKPVNEELQVRLTMAGVLSLLALMAFVILKDIYSYI
ncbi:MAG: site-2 protease family protein [Pirellulaceae bacterium]|nr:site-2 protease family protein [Pirellulaceae bacterium]